MTDLFASEFRGAAGNRSAAGEHDYTGARRKRIALIQTQAEAAGAQELSRLLGHGLDAAGYDVHHIFLFRRTGAFDQQRNTLFCATDRPAGPWSLIKMLIALVRHLGALQPDAVLCFQHYGNIVGGVAAWLAGTRNIIANRNSAKELVPAWARTLELVFGTTGLFKTVVVNSHTTEMEYEYYPRRFRSRIRRIDHGFATKRTDLAKAEARRRLALPIGATVLGCVARLHQGKNLAAAIRLLPVSDWNLVIAGQGSEAERLKSLAGELGVSDRLYFVGELSPARVGVLLRCLDVFVFPSLAETFGLAVVEAAEAGVPVVANDLEVLREVLSVDGQPCALFVDCNDTAAFAAAVRTILVNEPLRAALIARGAQLSQRYSLDEMVGRYAVAIEEPDPRTRKVAP